MSINNGFRSAQCDWFGCKEPFQQVEGSYDKAVKQLFELGWTFAPDPRSDHIHDQFWFCPKHKPNFTSYGETQRLKDAYVAVHHV